TCALAGACQTAFISKFDAAGGLVYSTLFGGDGVTSGDAIAVDPAGNAVVAGAWRIAPYAGAGDAATPVFPAASAAGALVIGPGRGLFAIKLSDKHTDYPTYSKGSFTDAASYGTVAGVGSIATLF